jgi:signal transduction histidine kinase
MAGIDGATSGAVRWLLPGDLLAAAGEGRGRRTARDWVVDVSAFGGAVLAGSVAAGLAQQYDRPPAWAMAVDLALGVLACVSLWWRRRFPLGMALAAIPAFAVSSSAFGAGIVIVVTLALYISWRRAVAVLSVYVACSAAYSLAVPWAGGWVATALVLACYLVFFAWGAAVRARRLLVVALRVGAERERVEHARQLAGIRRLERQAIAREMHDVLAHRISLVSVHAGALAYRARQARAGTGPVLEGGEIADSARVIGDNAHQALEELQEVLRVLRTDQERDLIGAMSPQPRIADLAALVREASDAGQVIDFRDGLDAQQAATLRPQAQRTVVRVVQEGLTNARKHAPGAPVSVRLSGGHGGPLTVEISNPPAAGPSGEAIPGGGTGLVGLGERVELEGGTLEHGMAGGTFRLRARLPWPGDGEASR